MPEIRITLEQFIRQLFAEHPEHDGHTQTLTTGTDGTRILVCSCGVSLVADR